VGVESTRDWTKAAGLLFVAAASVYSYRVIEATAGSKVSPASVASANAAARPTDEPMIAAPAAEGNTDVKLLEDGTDPFASGGSPTSQPTTGGAATSQPAATDGAAPTSQPSEGRSV